MDVVEGNGVESVFVHGATVSRLATFLNHRIPWVWILGHYPNEHVQWWESCLPLNKLGATIKADCRLVSYDLMLTTQQFVECVHDFENHGIVLVQASRRMPDTLLLSRIPEDQQSRVLISNGAFLRIYLPHAIETAHVQCFQKGYLAGTIDAYLRSDSTKS